MGRSNQDLAMAGRLVIVTGASSGVGYSTVRRLVLTEGATVVAIGRRRMFRIESLATQAEPGQLTALTGDMASRENANQLIAQVMEKFGRVDAFIHSVNRALKHTALEVTDTEFDLSMQVNVKSALYGLQALAPHFRRQRKGVVVIYNPTPEQTASFVAAEAVYTAAAHALSALTSGWSRQLDPFGVQVYEVAPAPPTESSLAVQPTHDVMLIETLRQGLFFPKPPASADRDQMAATVVKERGGLKLTSF
jgi:NAD(P)-dependent dehydrogenase (short-subunit alcohol dehydrogenase family)